MGAIQTPLMHRGSVCTPSSLHRFLITPSLPATQLCNVNNLCHQCSQTALIKVWHQATTDAVPCVFRVGTAEQPTQLGK